MLLYNSNHSSLALLETVPAQATSLMTIDGVGGVDDEDGIDDAGVSIVVVAGMVDVAISVVVLEIVVVAISIVVVTEIVEVVTSSVEVVKIVVVAISMVEVGVEVATYGVDVTTGASVKTA